MESQLRGHGVQRLIADRAKTKGVSNAFTLAGLGIDTIIGLAREGKLSATVLWMGAKGAARYVSQVASGNELDEAIASANAAICAGCPTLAKRCAVSGDRAVEVGYCGRDVIDKVSCACLVTMTVAGETVAAGKTAVRGESCPQGNWAS